MFSFFKPSSSQSFTDLGLLVLRIFVFIMLIPHGYDKLLSFLDGANDFPDPLHVGVRFSHFMTVLGEIFIPLLLIFGLFTRIAAVVEVGLFLVIAFVIHGSDPFGDKEHALLYLVPSLALLLTGAGKYSLDAALFQKK
ncbi:DoxX family protein [Runella sp. SP2]|uniref:DoxX family protein n=1 Tax=Runella sp. SP2 TaxID=2268026 RepID=UPI000F07922F|nr:DoxX family protein [Runella sp. SP2]AYQ33127.1 DoxX family protein [Runella sp. SP2]